MGTVILSMRLKHDDENLETFVFDCLTWDAKDISEMNYYVRNVIGNDATYYREEDPNIEERDKLIEVDYKAEDSESRKKNFVDIFDNNVWLAKESKSGDGSKLTSAKFAMRVLDKAVDLLKR